ncbi:hypothetical protein [Actinoplanes philippinensis]|uniref:hypothetical protein n=1 Tax=Actinoplanes philippinensis TaxID=35752 RepID=UPI00340A9FA8
MTAPLPPDRNRRTPIAALISDLAAAWAARRSSVSGIVDRVPAAGPQAPAPSRPKASPPGAEPQVSAPSPPKASLPGAEPQVPAPSPPDTAEGAATDPASQATDPAPPRPRRPAVWAVTAACLVLAAGAGRAALDDEEPAEPDERGDVAAVTVDVSDRLWQNLQQVAPRYENPAPPTGAPIPVDGQVIQQGANRLIFVGDVGDRARVIVIHVGRPDRDPALPNAPTVDVQVQVENIGRTRLSTDIERHVWLSDAQGRQYGYDQGRTASQAAAWLDRFDPGMTITRTVVFRVDPSATGLRAVVA